MNIVLEDLAPTDSRWDKAFPVLKQLRPDLDIDNFTKLYLEGEAKERLCYAAIFDDEGLCQAVVGWRISHKTVASLFYIDDLVVDESMQGKGLGKQVMAELEIKAKEAGCQAIALDTARPKAKEFYKNIGMVEAATLFAKSLSN